MQSLEDRFHVVTCGTKIVCTRTLPNKERQIVVEHDDRLVLSSELVDDPLPHSGQPYRRPSYCVPLSIYVPRDLLRRAYQPGDGLQCRGQVIPGVLSVDAITRRDENLQWSAP